MGNYLYCDLFECRLCLPWTTRMRMRWPAAILCDAMSAQFPYAKVGMWFSFSLHVGMIRKFQMNSNMSSWKEKKLVPSALQIQHPAIRWRCEFNLEWPLQENSAVIWRYRTWSSRKKKIGSSFISNINVTDESWNAGQVELTSGSADRLLMVSLECKLLENIPSVFEILELVKACTTWAQHNSVPPASGPVILLGQVIKQKFLKTKGRRIPLHNQSFAVQVIRV